MTSFLTNQTSSTWCDVPLTVINETRCDRTPGVGMDYATPPPTECKSTGRKQTLSLSEQSGQPQLPKAKMLFRHSIAEHLQWGPFMNFKISRNFLR